MLTTKEAIHILMLSPFYFRLKLIERLALVKEFMTIHNNKQGG